MIFKFIFSILFQKPVIQRFISNLSQYQRFISNLSELKRFISNLLRTNYELAQLYVDFFACSFSGCIFQNYGTVGIGEPMGIRVLSRRSISRSLSFLLPLCNEDTSPVTPSSDISGCDRLVLEP